MKKLTAILIALGASAGLAFGKIVYEDAQVSAANPDQIAQQLDSMSDRIDAESQTVAGGLLVEQLNHRVAHQLDQIARELDSKIDTKMSTYVL